MTKYLSIKRLSYMLAYYVADQTKEDHATRYVYYYAAQLIIGQGFETIVLLLLAWLMGILPETIAFSLSFMLIRLYAGGYHQVTYTKCFFSSLSVILGFSYLAKVGAEFYSYLFNIFCFLTAYLFVYLYAPSDTINKPITDPEHKKTLRLKALTWTTVWLIMSSILIYFSQLNLAAAVGLGAFIEGLSVTPLIAEISPLRRKCTVNMVQ